MRRYGSYIRKLLNLVGYDIKHFNPNLSGRNPYIDMKHLHPDSAPVIFDVGANVGQTVHALKRVFPRCIVHCFEPNPVSFQELQNNTSEYSDVYFWNCACGASKGTETFYTNSYSDMSSFLKPGELAWGHIESEILVEVRTIDEVCESMGIDHIDILKIDTQGFEMEVLRGATNMMAGNKINLLYLEIIIASLYEKAPRVDQLLQFLLDHNFSLVTFYEAHYQNYLTSWTDALFVNKNILK